MKYHTGVPTVTSDGWFKFTAIAIYFTDAAGVGMAPYC